MMLIEIIIGIYSKVIHIYLLSMQKDKVLMGRLSVGLIIWDGEAVVFLLLQLN
jgi:hypothetical protein